nr:isoform 2 of cleft lip and palate transmembrane protein 1 [Quercus suber]
MSGKAMIYKTLGTFIDDLFAFTIKMPMLHRLATLRDDVIFFVYLYQSWAYKVDPTRVNEFGQGGDDEEIEEKAANEPLTSPADVNTKEARKIDVAKDLQAQADGVIGSSGRASVTGGKKRK